jgi:hypothetical protein
MLSIAESEARYFLALERHQKLIKETRMVHMLREAGATPRYANLVQRALSKLRGIFRPSKAQRRDL